MVKTAEVVIIGGGINGCSTAYALASRGVKNIVLVEKGHIASGPTGRSSGVVRQHYSRETLAAMARDSVQVWKNFDDQIGGDAGFVRCGVVYFVSAKDSDSLQQTASMMQRIGIKAEVLSSKQLSELEPQLSAEDIACGTYEPDGGYADPALATNSFAEAAKRLGVEIMQRTTVTGLNRNNGAIAGVMTDRGEIATDHVINIAGPWGGQVAAMVGVHIPIVPSSHAVVILQRPQAWKSGTPVWADLIDGWYFKPERNAGIMVGSMQDIHSEEPNSIDDLPTVPSYDDTEEYSAAILRRFPVMKEGLARGGWVGVYDVTPDWQPVIDKISDVKGFYCAVGFSGHGFKIGPAVGKAVAELLVDGACHSYDLTMFKWERFKEHRSSRGAYAFGIVG
jgi:sarcosine oxidase, subunit beta